MSDGDAHFLVPESVLVEVFLCGMGSGAATQLARSRKVFQRLPGALTRAAEEVVDQVITDPAELEQARATVRRIISGKTTGKIVISKSERR